jgi:biotin carboxyl carrier protein
MIVYDVTVGGKTYRVEIEPGDRTPAGPLEGGIEDSKGADWKLRLDGRELLVNVAVGGPNVLSLLIAGTSFGVRQEREPERLHIFVRGESHEVSLRDPRSLRNRARSGTAEQGPLTVTATMPGKVVRVLARAGEQLSLGQAIVVVEAMKMQNEIRSPKEGVLRELRVEAGSSVNTGEVLAIVE